MTQAAVAVIIPFYQKRAGILRRSVESALEQKDVPLPRVIVVDDGSPVEARSELTDLLIAFPNNLESSGRPMQVQEPRAITVPPFQLIRLIKTRGA